MFIEYLNESSKRLTPLKPQKPQRVVREEIKNAIDILRNNKIKIKNTFPFKDRIEIELFDDPLSYNLKDLRGLNCEIKNGRIIQYFGG